MYLTNPTLCYQDEHLGTTFWHRRKIWFAMTLCNGLQLGILSASHHAESGRKYDRGARGRFYYLWNTYPDASAVKFGRLVE
jgi:hypothetical protein